MDKTYAYAGNEVVGNALGKRLSAAGFSLVEDEKEADFILTYFTSSTALEDAYFDERGFVQSARPGTVLVDLSPATPSFARELNAVAVVSDLAVVEAPLVVADITVTHAFSDQANLLCFVGGDETAVDAAEPLIEAVAGSAERTGGPGSSQLVRAAYTIQAAAQIAAAIEADALFRAVRRSSASYGEDGARVGAMTPQTELVLAAVEAGEFEGDYTLEMLMAELSAALMAADDVDLILPQAEACFHLLELLAVIGGADKAPAALSLVYGEEAACAQNGLDWTRAEQAYGEAEGYGDDDFGTYGSCDDEGCEGGHGHRHGHGGFPGGIDAYSAN